MTILIESLLPVFLLIVFGVALRRMRFVAEEGWAGMERISYFVFFPALLFQTIYKADFSELAAARSAGGFAIGIAVLLVLMLVARPALQWALGITAPAYSSLYQSVTRWNAFIVLAITEKIASPDMLAVVAVGIAVMLIPINIVNVAVVTALGEKDGPRQNVALQIAHNPLILSVLAGIAVRSAGLELPIPATTTIELLARISLPLGLILLGAGLRLRMPGAAIATVAVGAALKLLLMPLVLGGAAWALGVRGEELAIVALCGAGPSAMNGYLLARELGGDAPLLAAIVTAQTVVAFFTIPLVLALAGMPGIG